MDTEQLRLVLESVQNLGGDAKAVAICWLLVQCVTPVAVAGTIITIVFVIRGIALRAIGSCTAGYEIAKQLNIDMSDGWTQQNSNRIRERLEDLLRTEQLVLQRCH